MSETTTTAGAEYVTGIGRTVKGGKVHISNMCRPDRLTQGCHFGAKAQPMTQVIAVLPYDAARDQILDALLAEFVKPSHLCKDCFPIRTMAAYGQKIKAAKEAALAEEAAEQGA